MYVVFIFRKKEKNIIKLKKKKKIKKKPNTYETNKNFFPSHRENHESYNKVNRYYHNISLYENFKINFK